MLYLTSLVSDNKIENSKFSIIHKLQFASPYCIILLGVEYLATLTCLHHFPIVIERNLLYLVQGRPSLPDRVLLPEKTVQNVPLNTHYILNERKNSLQAILERMQKYDFGQYRLYSMSMLDLTDQQHSLFALEENLFTAVSYE